MSRPVQPLQVKSSLELIEEAIALLRAVPLGVFVGYYLGTVPFVLGGLYFWADMSASPFAGQHLAGAALGLAVLFLWMKFCQTLFAQGLKASLRGEAGPAPGLKGLLRIFAHQTIHQTLGLFVQALAFISVIGFPWVYAFYQNITVLDAGEAHT